MEIYRAKDYGDMSRKAANIIFAQVILKPDSVLGLATGSSPLGTYQELIGKYKKGDVDFSKVTTINLDEYCGLGAGDKQSYHYFMHENFFNHIHINADNIHIPNGLESDAAKECARFESVINRAGGIDLQLLGIGLNGHIGFNEPADNFTRDTHQVMLSESTIEANRRFFDSSEDVPKKAYTMGIGTIMQAKKIVLIASGEGKAEILERAFCGPVTPYVPASILQLHKDVSLVGDAAALSRMPKEA